MSPLTVLIIDRDPADSRDLWDRLQSRGCRVVATTTAEDGIVTARALSPDVVVLGRDLSDVDPLDLTDRIREALPNPTPTFLCSLHGPHEGELAISEPHGRRSKVSPISGHSALREDGRISYQGLHIDRRGHRALIDGRLLDLTPTEFRILWELANRPGCVFSRQDLTGMCMSPDRKIKRRTVDVHVKSIRRKLELRADLIETVRGIGYRLQEVSLSVATSG